MCVFLLSTVHHRNGKSVSTVTLCIRCTRVNAACHIVLRECASPDLKPFQSLCFLNFEQLIFTPWPKDMSLVDMVWLFLAFYVLTPACFSPLLSNIFKTSLPLCALKLVFIAFGCVKNRPPLTVGSTLTTYLNLPLLEMCCLKCGVNLLDMNHIQTGNPSVMSEC